MSDFILLAVIKFLITILWSFFSFLYNIQLSDNIRFGPVLFISMFAFMVLYIIIRPANGK